ncbi:MAG: hypothetical protein Q9195_004748 [Heterodermia aff. obscurata]
MLSPFALPFHSTTPGSGTVHLTLLPPSNPSFSTLNFTYPLKLLPSKAHTLLPLPPAPKVRPSTLPASSTDTQSVSDALPRPTSVPLLFVLTYGGGLLANDRIHLSLTLDAHTRLTLATQGSTKIYRAPPPPPPTLSPHLPPDPNPSLNSNSSFTPKPISSQTLHCTLYPHSSLFYSPHPTQPFASSHYAQVQIFTLHPGASLGLLDWVSEGRRARGESWDFGGWRGKNEVWLIDPTPSAPPNENNHENTKSQESKGKDTEKKRRLLLRDSVILEGGSGLKPRMSPLGIIGTLILTGPLLAPLADFFITEFELLPRIGARDWDALTTAKEEQTAREKWRLERQAREKADGVLWTAARVRSGRAVVVKFGAREVQGAREWVGAMMREEGSVGREFGEGALMGVG